MGKLLCNLILECPNHSLIAGCDPHPSNQEPFDVFTSPIKCTDIPDVIIDFSHPKCLDDLLKFSIVHSIPTVICTTGFSEEQIEQIHSAASLVPIFFSFNMSLGVNLLSNLAIKAMDVLGSDFNIEIIEKHHNKKIDSPSGTAFMLADAINNHSSASLKYVYGRTPKSGARKPSDIGIHAIRGGTIVGEHEVIFAGNDEIISISHTALSKKVFAQGAINAASFLIGKTPALYDMSNIC